MGLALALVVVCACGGRSPLAPSPLQPAPDGGSGGSPNPNETPLRPPRIIRTRFLAFGDSLTAGTTSPALRLLTMSAGVPESYPFKLQAILSQRYSEQTIDITNEGKAGEAAVDGSLRLPSVLKAIAPEVVFLLHGVNDVSLAGMAGVRRAADYVNIMARDARFGGAEVVICTYPLQRDGGFRAADPDVIAAYNRALRDVARGEGALLADFESGVSLNLIGLDGLHPTEEGYARMADVMLTLLKSAYEAKQ